MMMTAAERLLWQRVQSRARYMTPDIAAAMQRAFQRLRDSLTEAEILRAIETGRVERLISDALLESAMQPVRDEIRRGVASGFKSYTPEIIAAVKAAKQVGLSFDFLNPRVIDAIRELETKVVTTLAESIRDTVKAHVENGIRDGVNPHTTARSLRSIIGLAPNQLQEVENFRAALKGDDGRNPFTYTLRDKRYDAKIKRGELTDAEIEKMVEAYRKRRIAQNAATNARTAALDAQKLAQRMSWEDAAAKGFVDRARLRKTWIGVMDARERPEHVAMQGQTVGFDELFMPVMEMTPGESTYNCRCIARVTLV